MSLSDIATVKKKDNISNILIIHLTSANVISVLLHSLETYNKRSRKGTLRQSHNSVYAHA